MAMSKELTPRLRGPSRGAPMPRGAWPTLPQRKARRSRACPKPAAVARWAFHPGLSAVLSHFPAEIRTPTEPPLLGGGVSRLAPARLLPWTEKALSAQPGCPLTAASVVSGPRWQPAGPEVRKAQPLLGVPQLTQALSVLPPSAHAVMKIVEQPPDSGTAPLPGPRRGGLASGERACLCCLWPVCPRALEGGEDYSSEPAWGGVS
ncbi:uncharacterized protein LOC133087619 isoform X3 [Eubalaena glacialis]|uniref:uncharacterized protein LOC133087619 isoform X3 n=1 Tax=Eubalaena glacialis TaxID=27606 RepID=UPI002A5A9001|nr:uncharacterized protein LOC133087619 isoform X3 [Eubalaena glacialis]